MINEFRAGLTRTTDDEVSSHAGTNWAAQLGIPGTTMILGGGKHSVTAGVDLEPA